MKTDFNSRQNFQNKQELNLLIQNSYLSEDYDGFIWLSNKYFDLHGYDIELLKNLISVLILQKRFGIVQKYLNILSIDLEEYAVGYFLNGAFNLAKGNYPMANNLFRKAVKLGISKEYIEYQTGFKIKD